MRTSRRSELIAERERNRTSERTKKAQRTCALWRAWAGMTQRHRNSSWSMKQLFHGHGLEIRSEPVVTSPACTQQRSCCSRQRQAQHLAARRSGNLAARSEGSSSCKADGRSRTRNCCFDARSGFRSRATFLTWHCTAGVSLKKREIKVKAKDKPICAGNVVSRTPLSVTCTACEQFLSHAGTMLIRSPIERECAGRGAVSALRQHSAWYQLRIYVYMQAACIQP